MIKYMDDGNVEYQYWDGTNVTHDKLWLNFSNFILKTVDYIRDQNSSYDETIGLFAKTLDANLSEYSATRRDGIVVFPNQESFLQFQLAWS